MATIRIGLVGLGKIAREQHIPSLMGDPRFQLVAAATTSGASPVAIPVHATLAEMIAATPEKPPGVSVGEVEDITGRARERHLSLFASWHSRAAPAVQQTRAWIAGRRVRKAVVTWKEDVRIWHPGQSWIWQPGGLGAFDAGINALSIITAVMPRPLFVTRAVLHVPVHRQAPIAAELALADGAGATIDVALDFRQPGEARWDIAIETDAGQLELRRGGAELHIDGRPVAVPASQEYPRLYECFAGLIHAGGSDVDLAPLQLVADAFLVAHRVEVEPFED
ncbi:MAG: gfo/Idh/MocA family oxidoreductase [Deltaproteobacteria bacterium]|nr:MAG: gfo/Idh/MocA family oxidoreductase [Deltaproteobacteria bacterium]